MKVKVNEEIALNHARALLRNYQTAWPSSNRLDTLHYVAGRMKEFLKNSDSTGVDGSYDAWYDVTTQMLDES